MCGRFVQAQSAQSYAAHFGAVVALDEALDPSWNVAPTDRVYAVAEHDGERRLGPFRWGLIPWFAKEAKAAARHINARAETAATSPVFRDAFAHKRCLIPADGFYEWEKRESGG
jgi:putative SOS response-associated peptidase YedK